MTPRDMRIAIAEANGYEWTMEAHLESGYHSWQNFADQCGNEVLDDELPDYCNDLNAMHEVEKTLRYEMIYVINLHRICNNDQSDWDLPTTNLQFNYVTATSLQRAEAYLRTIGKWNES